MRSSRWPARTERQQLAGAVVVEVVVRLAPAPDHGVRRGDDDVADQLVARDALGQRGAGQADPGAQLEDVDRAEHLVEDPGHAVGRVDLGRRDLEQRGLPGAVGAEHHPALALGDAPRDLVEQGRPAPSHGHVGELDHRDHVVTLSSGARAGVG